MVEELVVVGEQAGWLLADRQVPMLEELGLEEQDDVDLALFVHAPNAVAAHRLIDRR